MSGETDWGQVATTGAQLGGSLYSSHLASEAAEDASSDLQAGLAQGLRASDAAIGTSRGDLMATGEAGLEDLISGFQGAINMLERPGQAEMRAGGLSGAYGPEAQQQAIDNFTSSPGQEYLRDEQEQSLLRNASAIGGLGGGRVRSALQEQAFGRAATNQQQSLQNLIQMSLPEQTRSSNIANILQSGGGQIANFRGGIGSNLANISMGGMAQQIPLMVGTGQAQMAGTLGASQAMRQGIGNVSDTLGNLSF